MRASEYYSNVLVLFNMLNSVDLPSREISVLRTKKELDGVFLYRLRKKGVFVSSVSELTDEQKKLVPYPPAMIRCMRARKVDKLGILMEKNEVLSDELIPEGMSYPTCPYRTIYASTGKIWWKTVGLAENFYRDNAETRKRWNERYPEALTGQDLCIDIDVKDGSRFEPAYEVAQKIKEFYDKYNLPYGINFSGSKGFHIRTFWESMTLAFPKLTPLEAEPLYLRFIEGLVEYLELDSELVDRSTLHKRQPLRIPYSLHSSGLVCLPLNDRQFDDFRKDMAKPEEVLKLRLYDPINFKEKGFNRGMCYRYGDTKMLSRLVTNVSKKKQGRT